MSRVLVLRGFLGISPPELGRARSSRQYERRLSPCPPVYGTAPASRTGYLVGIEAILISVQRWHGTRAVDHPHHPPRTVCLYSGMFPCHLGLRRRSFRNAILNAWILSLIHISEPTRLGMIS